MENKGLNKKRISRFAVVGLFNTAFDFGILNTLVFVFGLSSIAANIVSSTIAASASFFLNHSFVFKSGGQKTVRNFVVFLAITMLGLYGLQNLIIFTLTHYLTAPSGWCYDLLNWISEGTFSREFVQLNFAKGVATIASLIWNYFMYARFVFKTGSSST